MKKYIFLLFLFVSCTSPTSFEIVDEYHLSIDGRLEMDGNGHYTLPLNQSKTQTVHRVGGSLLKNGKEPYPPEKVSWESSHYWVMTDTVGYVVRRILTPNGEWVNVDTSYVVGFGGYEVPTINSSSYTGKGGEINTMIAPINSMVGDTMIVKSSFQSITKTIKIILQ